jgi:hypothetical protein
LVSDTFDLSYHFRFWKNILPFPVVQIKRRLPLEYLLLLEQNQAVNALNNALIKTFILKIKLIKSLNNSLKKGFANSTSSSLDSNKYDETPCIL